MSPISPYLRIPDTKYVSGTPSDARWVYGGVGGMGSKNSNNNTNNTNNSNKNNIDVRGYVDIDLLSPRSAHLTVPDAGYDGNNSNSNGAPSPSGLSDASWILDGGKKSRPQERNSWWRQTHRGMRLVRLS
jgi:hypothetical protein